MTSTHYPTDLTNAQWENLLPYLPEPSSLGRPLKWEMRSIINAMFYIVKSGCQWRMLPHQMPPWQTVYSHFRKWKIDGTWFMIHQALHEQTRRDVGKVPSPTVAIIDSQSVKTTELATSRGFDAHKKVKGRKRHIVTDTIGIPLGVKVTDANISDNQVAIELLTEIFSWQITIQLVCADAGYRGKIRRLFILDASVSIGNRSTSWAIGVCGCPIALDCGAHLFLVRLVSPIDFGL